MIYEHKIKLLGDFPSSPVVTHSSSNAVDASSVPGQGAEMPHDLRPENQNRKYDNIVTNSIKVSKTVTSKKIIILKNIKLL